MTERNAKDKWPIVAFGDVAKQVKDKVSPADSGLDRYIAGEHMDTDDLRIRRWGIIGNDYLGPAFHMRFKPGQILYGSRRTYLRKVAVADFEGITANTTFVIESKDPAILLPELLPFIMQTESFHAFSIKQSKGSTNPYVNFSDLVEYEFVLPPLEEQQRVADILEELEQTIESLISLRRVARSAWRSMSQEEFSKKNSSQIKELGKFYRREKRQVTPSEALALDLPLVGPEHIAKATGDIENKPLGLACDIESNKFYFHPGSVLYSRIRPNFQKAVLVDFSGICSTEIYALHPTEDIKGEYLLDLLLSPEFTRFAISGTKGTGFPRVSHDHIEKFPVVVPSLNEQIAYLSVAIPSRKSSATISRRLSHLGAVKATILEEFIRR